MARVALPLVSVVTPVLNRADTIAGCLASVAAQTHPKVEHIVMDGGSTDETLDVVEAFPARHDLHWVSGPDRGMYDAINNGLKIASGDVFAYLNSDDMWFPWMLEVAVDALQEGADLVYGDLALIACGRRFLFQPPLLELLLSLFLLPDHLLPFLEAVGRAFPHTSSRYLSSFRLAHASLLD
jgi:glycosyltransferase involved in cell wall biosynthesis